MTKRQDVKSVSTERLANHMVTQVFHEKKRQKLLRARYAVLAESLGFLDLYNQALDESGIDL